MPQTHPDKPAVTIWPSGQAITHRQLDEAANRFAHLLLDGENPNEGGIAFLLANQVEYPIAMRGARLAGYDQLPLNTHSPAGELLEVLLQFRPQVVVVGHRYFSKAAELHENLPGTRFIVTGSPIVGWENFDYLLSTQPSSPVISESTGRLLLLSGGSTGTPKIVIRPNAQRTDTPLKGGALA